MRAGISRNTFKIEETFVDLLLDFDQSLGRINCSVSVCQKVYVFDSDTLQGFSNVHY